MKTRRKYSKLLSGMVSLVVLLGVCFGWGGGVGAVPPTSTATVVITGGPLKFDTSPLPTTFDPITLDGNNQFSHADLSAIDIRDTRGTGVGWDLTVQASQFRVGADGITLPEGSMGLNRPALTSTDSLVPPSFGTEFTEGSSVVIDNGSSKILIDGIANQGMGLWKLTFPTDALTLNLKPDTALAGTFVSTITWTLIVATE